MLTTLFFACVSLLQILKINKWCPFKDHLIEILFAPENYGFNKEVSE